MSAPIPPVYPISLKHLDRIISTTTTCIGSPFTSPEQCSQRLIRSPNVKRRSSAKDKLGEIIQSMDEDIIAITKENISKLKSIAKPCICSDHQALSTDFAYYWLASARLARFLNHMSWSMDAIKWRCLASGDPSCNSILDCFSSTELHDTVRGLLNRIIIGQERYKSLRELARHWFCSKHQEDTNTFKEMLKKLRQQCGVYWSSIGLHRRRTRRPGLRVDNDTSNLEDDSSHLEDDSSHLEDDSSHPEDDSFHLDSSVDNSLVSDSSDTVDSTDNDTLDKINAPSRILQPNARPDVGQVPDDPLPWNDPGIFEDDGEYEFQADSHLSTVRSTQSPGAPTASPLSTIQANSDIGLSYPLPGTFDVDETSVVEQDPAPGSPCSSPSTGRLSTPEIPHTPSKDPTMPLHPSPSFKRCEYVSNETVFNKVLRRIKDGLPPHTGDTNDGYIYVYKVVRSPNHVKVGRTNQTIQQRGKQVSHCAGNIIPVKEERNICRVPHHVWLEKTILESLKSRQCSFTCLRHKCNGCDQQVDHEECFEGDAIELADLVELFRQWMWSDPYDENGRLFSKWQRRIDFFETYTSRYQYLLAESSPCKAWSIFLDPPWWIRLHMVFYEEFLCRRGNSLCRWTRIRENRMDIVCDAAFRSAASIVLLHYAGCYWIWNPMTIPLIFLGVLCRLVWQI